MKLILAFFLVISTMVGCGGGGSSSPTPSITYTLSGAISGLTSAGLNITNGNDTVLIEKESSAFIFPTPLTQGSSYSVTIKTQPAAQACTVSNGSGTIDSASVTNIKISCVTNAYFIGGVINNYTSSGLILANENDRLEITGSGPFSMPQPVAAQQSFNLYVQTQPKDQTCSVTFGSGTVVSSTINNIQVNCVPAVRQYIYVTNSGSDNISAFSLNINTGFLTPVAGSPFPSGATPQSLTATPSNKFLYTANAKNNSISGYAINAATGQLASMTGSPFATGKTPSKIAIDRTGQYLFAANSDDNTISIYALEPSTGLLNQVTGSPFKTGSKPIDLQMDGTGNFIYVANSGDKTISGFTFNKNNGFITPIADSPYLISNDFPISLEYDNQILRVNNSLYFSINPSSGSLTLYTPPAIPCYWNLQVLNDKASGLDTTSSYIININYQRLDTISILSRYGSSYCGTTYSETPESPFPTGKTPSSALVIAP